MAEPDLDFYHCPNTRSTGVRILLEELGAPYRLHALNMKAGEHLGEAYRAVNPMAKVPAIRHRGALVTEQPAIYLYLADLFPEAGLAPGLTDPLRGPYLRWTVFYGSAFEPAMIDRHLKRDPGPRGMSPYGDGAAVVASLVETLGRGPYILGERFSAADVLWGTAVGWMLQFGILGADPVLQAYAARIRERPAAKAVAEAEARLAAEHAAAAA